MRSTKVSVHPCRQVHLIMGAVSLWTRHPWPCTCVQGPKKSNPQLIKLGATTLSMSCNCGEKRPHSGRRSAPATLRKLHDHHAELECQRSAAFGETKESGSSALPPAVPPSAAYREQYDHSGQGMRPWALR